MTTQVKTHQDANGSNPLDHVEDVLNGHNWVYDRMNDAELVVEVAGNACDYRLLFVWDEQLHALQLCCQYDLSVNDNNITFANTALSNMNRSLWMGHFELSQDTFAPCFRHTSLLRGYSTRKGTEYVQDLVDISLTQCERFQAVFQMLSNETQMNHEMLSLGMMETAGQA